MKIAHIKSNNDYFWLCIPLRDKIRFESKLLAMEIEFHFDESYSMPENDIRYFFREEDSGRVEDAYRSCRIRVVSADKELVSASKPIRLTRFYIKVSIIVVVVFIIVSLLLTLFTS